MIDRTDPKAHAHAKDAKDAEDAKDAKHEAEAEGLLATIRSQPIRAVTLVLCMIAGATLGLLYIPEEALSVPRRLFGGALLGGLSWLLVMVGRII
jgi:hypothetical protein